MYKGGEKWKISKLNEVRKKVVSQKGIQKERPPFFIVKYIFK